MVSRRGFMAGLLAGGLSTSLSWADAGAPIGLTAAKKANGDFALCGLKSDGALAFMLDLPGRGHAATAHPHRPEAVAFARRPGRFALVLDCVAGRVLAQIDAPDGRHFYGHGAYSADGSMLFTTENDYEAGEGRVGIWDVGDDYLRVGEFSSGGIGPHELRLMPDGQSLVIANGGIDTHPDSGRMKLNIPTMMPNLTYVSLEGRILDQVFSEQAARKNSIRHLAVAPDGLVAAAMQWQGAEGQASALLSLNRLGEGLRALEAPDDQHRTMQGYAGSVAFSRTGGAVAISSPRGGRVQVFDTTSGLLKHHLAFADVCGLAPFDEGFLATSGTGEIRKISANNGDMTGFASHAMAFDNHLVAL